MLPRTHIILGAIFTLLLYLISPKTPAVYLVIVFLSSFLIDFDHYMTAAYKIKTLHFGRILNYYDMARKRLLKEKEKDVRKKGDFFIFHTVEFHALVGVIGIFFLPFLYVFIGMVFHSLLDVFSLLNEGIFYKREYFFFNWLRRL